MASNESHQRHPTVHFLLPSPTASPQKQPSSQSKHGDDPKIDNESIDATTVNNNNNNNNNNLNNENNDNDANIRKLNDNFNSNNSKNNKNFRRNSPEYTVDISNSNINDDDSARTNNRRYRLNIGNSSFNANESLVIRTGGDIVLGGIFPMHELINSSYPCGRVKEEKGIQRLEAMMFALDLIKNDTNLLPNITLGSLIIDSCGSDTFALEQSMEFVRYYMNKVNK